MRKWLSFFTIAIVALCIFNASIAEANSFREVKVVSGSTLVVKDQASPSAKTVATLKRGQFVTVFSTSNGWASIQFDQTKGFVNASFLGTPTSVIKIASSKSGLVVKESPSKSASTLATLKYNMIVEDFGVVGNGYSFVQYGNVTGYVATNFINQPKTTQLYTKSEVNVRNIASKSGAKVATINASQAVTVHSTLAGWSYVSFGKVRGYTESANLVAIKPATSSVQNILTAKDYLPQCNKTYTYHYTAQDNTNTMLAFTCQTSTNTKRVLSTIHDGYPVYFEFEVNAKNGLLVWVFNLPAFPLKEGQTWTGDWGPGSKIMYEVLEINGSLTTPAGNFKNVLTISQKITHEDDEFDYLYHQVSIAPGAGIIGISADGYSYRLQSIK